MNIQAFDILGIDPTTDGRVIRAAFVRLARIYHPDRFVGMPDDVRAEAERRMKDATLAYQSLRAEKASGAPEPALPPISSKDLRERARLYKETIEAKKSQEKQNRARWRRWDELEQQARDRAALDAQIAAAIAQDVNGSGKGLAGVPVVDTPDTDEPSKPTTPKEESLLAKRLSNARRGETAPLARRSD